MTGVYFASRAWYPFFLAFLFFPLSLLVSLQWDIQTYDWFARNNIETSSKKLMEIQLVTYKNKKNENLH